MGHTPWALRRRLHILNIVKYTFQAGTNYLCICMRVVATFWCTKIKDANVVVPEMVY